MAGESARAAVAGYLTTIVELLRHVVPGLHSGAVYATSFTPGASGRIVLNRNDPLRITTRTGEVLPLDLLHEYRLSRDAGAHHRERFDVSLTKYIWAVGAAPADKPLLEFHWHPEVEGIRFPHLHLRRAQAVHPAFAHAHIPTGQVSLADLSYLLIRDFDVPPGRSDWEQTLAEGRLRPA